MAESNVYIKLERNIEVQSQDVFLSDVAKVRCRESAICARIKAIKIHKFHEKSPKRCVIGILRIIEEIEKECENVTVECLGETDVLVEWISVDKHKGWVQGIKTALVAIISFFGTGFTIIAYHNDIGITDVFSQVYRLVMGGEPQGINILEVSYSIGLGAGIILFFNHVGGRRLTKDPTPIEVAMRKYENEVNMTLVETADREGKTIDVD